MAAVRTAVISDLHLGTLPGNDVLRMPAMRERLFEAAADVDRLVILGDLAELREAPVGQALGAVYEFADHLNEAFAGRQVVIAAGNHDHPLVASWLEGRRLRANPQALPVESCVKAPRSGPLGTVVRRLPDCEVFLAYPGLRLRDDVYATHGHYLDVHLTVPRPESVMASAMCRLTGRRGACRSVADHEAVLAPVYGFLHGLAQGGSGPVLKHGSRAARRFWSTVSDRSGRQRVRAYLIGAITFPAAVALLNRAGIGPLEPVRTGAQLRRSGLRAMSTVLEGMGVRAEHVLFGHTHRPGPLAEDDPAEWMTASGTQLWNTGSWLYEGALVKPRGRASPYWPGAVTYLRDEGPPELTNVLRDVSLRARRVAA